MNRIPRTAFGLPLLALIFCTGCPVPQQRGLGKYQFVTEPNKGGQYHLYLPVDYVKNDGKHPLGADHKWPLVMTFHGMKPYDSALPQEREWEKEADNYGYVVCAPCLDTSSSFMEYPLTKEHNYVIRDRDHVIAIMDHIFATTKADPRAVLSTSWSCGGYLAHYFVNRYPDRFSCIATRLSNFSPSLMLEENVSKYRQTPVAIFIGDGDFPACKRESEAAVAWYTAHGFRTVHGRMIDNMGHSRIPQTAAAFFAEQLGIKPLHPMEAEQAVAKVQMTEYQPPVELVASMTPHGAVASAEKTGHSAAPIIAPTPSKPTPQNAPPAPKKSQPDTVKPPPQFASAANSRGGSPGRQPTLGNGTNSTPTPQPPNSTPGPGIGVGVIPAVASAESAPKHDQSRPTPRSGQPIDKRITPKPATPTDRGSPPRDTRVADASTRRGSGLPSSGSRSRDAGPTSDGTRPGRPGATSDTDFGRSTTRPPTTPRPSDSDRARSSVASAPPRDRGLPPPAPAPREVAAVRSATKAKRVNIQLAGPAIGSAPYYLSYSADLPVTALDGADFLWMDNGVWMGDEPRGSKILESPGLHRISVLVITRNNEEYRGATTVQILEHGPSRATD